MRRQSWQTDFFNPDVPLHTIGDKIPHAKGHDLLVLLQDNKVPISRAVWYVRGLGGNEIVCLLPFVAPLSQFSYSEHSKECEIGQIIILLNTVLNGLMLSLVILRSFWQKSRCPVQQDLG